MKKNLSSKKMNGEDRKCSIVDAAAREFSGRGFHGTSIRDIAQAAGVSEALLYRHFPSKKALYNSLGDYVENQVSVLVSELKDHKPSAETLVYIIYCLVLMIHTGMPRGKDKQKTFERLLVHSFMENTRFAKMVFSLYNKELAPLWNECVKAAVKDKAIQKPDRLLANDMWFAHHLAMIVNILHFSGGPVFPYRGTRDELINELVHFILMGIGMTEDAIGNYYKTPKLRKFFDEVFSGE